MTSRLAYRVVIAQTTRGRARRWSRSLLVYSLVPQLVLLAVLAVWLWRGIDRELHPLGELEAHARASRCPRPGAGAGGAQSRANSSSSATRSTRCSSRSGTACVRAARVRRQRRARAAHAAGGHPRAGRLRPGAARIRRSGASSSQQIAASQARASHLVDQLLALALADEGRTGIAARAGAPGPAGAAGGAAATWRGPMPRASTWAH